MKPICALAFACLLAACSSTEPTTLNNSTEHKAKAGTTDVVVFAKNTAGSETAETRPQVLGNWVLHTMQRNSTQGEETLNISMELLPDNTYLVSTGCGDIKGRYTIKEEGAITFHNTATNTADCSNREQVQEMVRLLTTQVTQFSANGNMLFLKDSVGNNVFRVMR